MLSFQFFIFSSTRRFLLQNVKREREREKVLQNYILLFTLLFNRQKRVELSRRDGSTSSSKLVARDHGTVKSTKREPEGEGAIPLRDPARVAASRGCPHVIVMRAASASARRSNR